MDFIKYVLIVLLVSIYFISESTGLLFEACFEDQTINLTFTVNGSRYTKDQGCCVSPVTVVHGAKRPQPTLVPIAIESECTSCLRPLYSVPTCTVCMQPLALDVQYIYDRSSYSLTIERDILSETKDWTVRISVRVLSEYKTLMSRILMRCNKGELKPTDEIGEEYELKPTDESPIERDARGKTEDSNEQYIPTSKLSYKDTGVTSAAGIAGWCIAIGLACILLALFVYLRLTNAKNYNRRESSVGYSPDSGRHLNEPETRMDTKPPTTETPIIDASYEPLRSDMQTDHCYTEIQTGPAVGDHDYLHPISDKKQRITSELYPSYFDASIGNQDTTDNLPLYKL